MRAQGMLYQQQGADSISNLYNIKLVNKTRNYIPVELKVEDGDLHGNIRVVGQGITVKPETVGDGVFFVVINKNDLHHRKNAIRIGVYSNGSRIDVVKTNFMAPSN